MLKSLRLDQVKVGDRIREDLGDIASLAASIEVVGLLQPIVVTPKNDLIAGLRRLRAFDLLRRKEIPAYVVSGLDEALPLLKAEIAENSHRKDFTPLELVKMGRRLEEMERPRAKERKESGKPKRNRDKKGDVKFTSPPDSQKGGSVRDRVAEVLGVSGPTYEKAKEVVVAAEKDPDHFGDLPLRMEADGSVNGAYQEMKRRQQPKPAPPRHPHSDRLVRWLEHVSGEPNVINIELGGIEKLLKEKGKWNWRDVREFILPMMEALQKTIGDFHREIKKHAAAN